jgi:hypothetical protein
LCATFPTILSHGSDGKLKIPADEDDLARSQEIGGFEKMSAAGDSL